VGRLLTDVEDAGACLVQIRMRDGALMPLDVRSRTERWSYWTGEYDRRRIDALARCLDVGSVVLDVGANVGFYSIALGRRLASLGGKLHAFEPVPNNFARLQGAVALNDLAKVIVPHNVALGDASGRMMMHREEGGNASTGNAILLPSNTSDDDLVANTVVDVVRLDDFARDAAIGACRLIKLDIEGAELLFLRGGAGFIAEHRPIILGEFSVEWSGRFGRSFTEVADLVEPWGYRFFEDVSARRHPLAQIEHSHFEEVLHPRADLEDVLLVPDDAPAAILRGLGLARSRALCPPSREPHGAGASSGRGSGDCSSSPSRPGAARTG
jgi:FkbM family methyltransferase